MPQQQQHPITPPPKLVGDWLTEAADLHLLIPSNLNYLATRAAQWGADQELEALLVWLRVKDFNNLASDLLAARRPKPPSLAEQGMDALRQTPCREQCHYDAMFAAFKRLAELEALND
jgi:hypothetical protein